MPVGDIGAVRATATCQTAGPDFRRAGAVSGGVLLVITFLPNIMPTSGILMGDQCYLEDNMKPRINFKFLTGIIAVCLIVILGILTGTYYGTRLPLGTLTSHYTLTQAW
jgi:hypothetical protein